MSSSATYLYNSVSGKWVEKQSMTMARSYHACTLYKGNIWVDGSKSDDTVEIYFKDTDSWEGGPNLPYSAALPGEFVEHDDKLYYIGGWSKKDIHQLNDVGDEWIPVIVI